MNDVVEIPEDLVGCVIRQGRFVDKMNRFDWILDNVIFERRLRYRKFLEMLMDNGSKTMLVPILDIDLVWHTHQLSTYYYFLCCLDKSKSKTKRVIDHDDKVEEIVLAESFTNTCKIYSKRYGMPYSVCYC